jgi:PKD repeat protein
MPGFDEHDQNTKVQFDEPGYYTVSLTASNAAGSDTETKVDYILAYLPEPAANFTADNTMPLVNENVQFTDLSFYYPDTWEWMFTPNTGIYTEGTDENTQNPVVQFTEAGYYTVQLTVTNESGTDTEIKTDYIHAVDALTVEATATPPEICIYDSVQLHAEVAGGSGDYTFEWSSDPEGFSSTEQDAVAYPE